MPLADDLRAEIAVRERRQAEIADEGRRVAREIAALRAALAVAEGRAQLPQVTKSDKVASMPRTGRPREINHPFAVAASAAAGSVSAWADQHGIDRASLQNYMKGRRPIPRARAVLIQETLGVPLDAWARVSN